MIRFISNVPIFRRLFFAFAAAALIAGVVIVTLGNFDLSSLTTQGQAVRTSFDAQSAASQEDTNLQRMNAVLEAFHNEIFGSLSGVIKDQSFFSSGALLDGEVRAREAEFDQALQTYQSNYEIATSPNMSTVHSIMLAENPTTGNQIINSQQAALGNVINHLWPQYKSDQDAVLSDLETLQNELLNQATNGFAPTPAAINQIYEKDYEKLYRVRLDFTNLNNNWGNVVSAAVNMGKAVTAVGPSQTQPILLATTIAFIFMLIVLITTGWVVNITITQPLQRLAVLARRIGKGDMSARSKMMGQDEIGRVADAMNNMLDNIVYLIQEANNQRDALQAQVEKLVGEVSGVGEGDLRIQAEVTTDTLGVLADSFNYMVEELGSVVVRMKMAAYEVGNSTTMTYERMSQLVKIADTQLRRIADSVVEVERMADSSRQVAEHSRMLFSIAQEARQTAQVGRTSVQRTIEGMGRIHEHVQETSNKVQALSDSSREINNIVEVIAYIAHQTNRLALDAAIQAAMAGENNKGFGAIAADIRRLAERAKEQASMIAHIVHGVRDDISAAAVSMQDTERETSIGATVAEETGTALGSIFSVVDRQAHGIEIINKMAAQQLQSSSTVAQIMHYVSDSTQQSSASTREAAQNMERLTLLAEQLLASVETFKLRENMNYYSVPSNVTVTPEQPQQQQFSISGVFRTITSSAQSREASTYGNENGNNGNGAFTPSNPPGPPTPYQPGWGTEGNSRRPNGDGQQQLPQRFPTSPGWQ
ncbi:MAG TPA: methyl-accepting chemotaxis protein [Ktedonobacteraceae bacterium]|nr:methyl-accepting chemotaxis protein [Ktedonobacteraceae bacterium]